MLFTTTSFMTTTAEHDLLELFPSQQSAVFCVFRSTCRSASSSGLVARLQHRVRSVSAELLRPNLCALVTLLRQEPTTAMVELRGVHHHATAAAGSRTILVGRSISQCCCHAGCGYATYTKEAVFSDLSVSARNNHKELHSTITPLDPKGTDL